MEAPARDVLPDGFSHRSADLGNGVRLSYLIGGKGQPVVLLHGWPETGYAWRKVMPQLVAAGYLVIVPDLRGFGASSKPAGGYDRLTMADDIHRLISGSLGLGTVFAVGHDWGGSTAAAWAGAHPEEVSKLVVIEAQPRGPWSGQEPWFYALHKSKDLAEALTAGRERTYLTWFYRNFAANPDAITPSEINVYLRSYGSSAGMRPGFELVRALPRDVEANREAAKSSANILQMRGAGRRRGGLQRPKGTRGPGQEQSPASDCLTAHRLLRVGGFNWSVQHTNHGLGRRSVAREVPDTNLLECLLLRRAARRCRQTHACSQSRFQAAF